MIPLSEKTLALLYRAGWSEDRRVDTAKWEEYYESEGLPLHPCVKEFLSRYGGLYIKFPDVFGKPDGNELIFDPREAFGAVTVGQTKGYSQRAQAALIPIGLRDGKISALLMDENGKVYACNDGPLVRFHDSDCEIVEILLDYGPNFEDIP